METNYLVIDLETTGLPITRNYARRCERYPNPKYNIAYDQSRLLSISVLPTTQTEPILFIRDDGEIPDSAYNYEANRGKYKSRKSAPMTDIICKLLPYFSVNNLVFIGHNILFDLNILANECLRCSAESELLIEIGTYDRDIFSELHDIIMLAISEYRYRCTMEMAKMLGIDDKDIGLSSVVNVLNTDSNYCGEMLALQYHESEDDVKACAYVFKIINQFLNQIPKSIDEITDSIYDPHILGSTETATKYKLELKLKYNTFLFYHKKLNSARSVLYASERAEFFIEEINELLFSIDGFCTIIDLATNEKTVKYVPYLVVDYVDKCISCNTDTISDGKNVRCTNCCINDYIFEKAEEFNKMNSKSIHITASEFAAMIPKHGIRRSRRLNIETGKKGRSYSVPNDKASFYINNKLYEYFSLKIGSKNY